MFVLPNQSVEEWEESLRKIASLEPEHISAYSLIIEEDTGFYKLWENNKLLLPNEEEERIMYSKTKATLASYGYKQYEISNYAKEGYECYHNKVYWKCEEYLGLGSASSSFINEKRIKNIEDVKTYIERINKNESIIDEVIENKNKDNIEEFIFMGLRMLEGINLSEFKNKFNTNIEDMYKEVIEKNINNNLLIIENDRLKLTSKGIELSNSVMSDFIIL